MRRFAASPLGPAGQRGVFARYLSSNGSASVRAHTVKGSSPLAGGTPGVIGVRREDKNKWERRAPIAPRHVEALVNQGLRVVVQPCTRRVFMDTEYLEVGAEIREDLSECAAIVAVKEVPPELLLPGRTWCFFSHTIKAQPSGMALLDVALEKNVRLVDYECITETGNKGGKRLVAFGAFAGYAGAIDFLRGLGERFLALGFSTPLLHIGSAFMYPSLEEAKRAVSLAGDAIRKHGLPKALCPFTAVFTGTGNVTQGALEIFKLLPHELVKPGELPGLCERADGTHVSVTREDCHKLYLSIATAEHMVRRRDGGAFDKAQYYAEPELYESVFQDDILPYSTVICNGMYWDARFPRLFTREDVHRQVVSGRDKLLGVCDITCDADGSVPTRQFASIEQPFHILNAMTEEISFSLDEAGVLFHAVDHLPSELPREASEHFGDCLLPFLPALASERAPVTPGKGLAGSDHLPMPIRGAIIVEGGALGKNFRYITQLRELQRSALADEVPTLRSGAFRSHGALAAPPASCTLELTGHLFDTHLINRVCDICEAEEARLQILLLEVGRNGEDTTFVSFMVKSHSSEDLEVLVDKIKQAAAEESVQFRRASAGAGGNKASTVVVELSAQRKVLVLGSGYVARPMVEYLLRRPENVLTIASIDRKEVEALAEQTGGSGGRVLSKVVDLGAAQAGSADAAAAVENLVKDADMVISFVPAPLHAGVARLAVQYKVPLITASYVSPEMQSLHDAAQEAGVLLLNEVGLDPGIDHLSAMRMIDSAKAAGSKIIRFSSLCGGLPAPEAAGSNPIGYKFSWSPRGVLTASRNPARFMEDGVLQEIPGENLLASGRPLTINNAFALDVLPNRDSTQFAELYGLADAPTFFRGTLRYRGFCNRMLALAKLGLLDLGPLPALQSSSRRRWLAELLGAGAAGPGAAEALAEQPAGLIAALRARLAAGPDAEDGLDFVCWLRLLEDEDLPSGVPVDRPVDVTARLLQRPETAFQPGERDMVIMRHEIDVQRTDGQFERHVSTLIEYGEPHGTTAMAKTVGLTTGICAQLVLDDPARFGAGVQRPLRPQWYEPVLPLLEAEGIRLSEHVEPLFEASRKVC
ncbi:unnamed protein product [Polarella glacialis]|uniref:Saccharopine dehydrogenase (NAD(+), L-glutamate-forming) n=1 Tax=Polarella glacialis TaxID=89957 RepID=A0A813EA13_POLGL|nr:unnamed protein product [Polarella glacialis]